MVLASPPSNRTWEGKKARWEIASSPPPGRVPPAGVSPMLAHLLYRRGIDTAEAITAFLAGLPAEHDPFLLHDMDRAVERIRSAAAKGESVAIWGDFDADGLTAAAVLQETLRAVGLDPRVIIPHRDQGHGVLTESLAGLAQDGISFLVTGDCGIGNVEAVAAARALGMDVIITDHHEAPKELPDCPIVAPTHPDSRYPFARLAGSGVAYKLAQALLEQPERYEPLLDLVVLGTVADVVPLIDENRAIVSKGLLRLRETPRAGLNALLRVAGINKDTLDGESIGFYLGPRINAANRMDDPTIAYRLLTTTDRDEADHLAGVLDTFNAKRQEEVQAGLKIAIETVGHPLEVKEAIRDGKLPPIVCVLGEWGPGISGLVASELTQRYCVPAMVGSPKPDGTVSVSARSVRGVNVWEIQSIAYETDPSAFLGSGGGHAAACGFPTTMEKLPRAFELLAEAATGRVPIGDLIPTITIDAQVGIGQMNAAALARIQELEPYGHEFESPVFLAQRVWLSGKRTIGNGGKHLTMTAKSGNARVGAIIFNSDPEIADIPEEQLVDIVFNLRRNEYGGTWAPQLNIRDWRESG